MSKQTLLTVIIAIGIVVGIGLLTVKKPADGQNSTILYYGITCPHCKEVEKYIADNKIKDKIKLGEKEIYEDKENNQELLQRAKDCNLAQNNIVVPFLWTEGKCIIGTTDIIKYFSEKLNISSQEATASGIKN